jgi:hypothetical protein
MEDLEIFFTHSEKYKKDTYNDFETFSSAYLRDYIASMSYSPPSISSHNHDFLHNAFEFLVCRNAIEEIWRNISVGLVESSDILKPLNCNGSETSSAIIFQQESILGRPINKIDELYTAADIARTQLEAILQRVVCEANMDLSTLHVPPLKDRLRAIEKANDDYFLKSPGPSISWLYDIARAAIICDEEDQICQIVKMIFECSNDDFQIIRLKNRFLHPTPGGFRDLNLNIRMQIVGSDGRKFGHICELQIHLRKIKEMDILKKIAQAL